MTEGEDELGDEQEVGEEEGDDQALHRLLGLTDQEYEQILATLGRDPRPAELAMFSVVGFEL